MLLKGSQTEKNILTAFAGESQAKMRYVLFASQAKKEGFQAISKIFLETADHEKEHASRLFKFLEGGMREIQATFPAGKIGTTLENLKLSINGENEESSDMYPKFSEIAKQEGFLEIAAIFRNIGNAEIYHESRFRALTEAIENNTIFKEGKKVLWFCTNCGMWHIGEEAPKECPACRHEQGYFISDEISKRTKEFLINI